jgi:glycosyltransferase involved in cell wall biosynthesis
VFLISSPDPIPEIKAVAGLWREECTRAGVGNPFLVSSGSAFGAGPEVLGFDAIVEFVPLGAFPRGRNEEIVRTRADFEGDTRCYRSYVGQLLACPRPEHIVFRTVMPAWDETARGLKRYRVFVNANPETFAYWMERVLDETRLRFHGDYRLLFVRAWNEWDAACHLEPDARLGRRNLEALREALQRAPRPEPLRPAWSVVKAWAAPGGGIEATRIVRSDGAVTRNVEGPLVSVVMPAYNHERFVVEALDSVVAQSHRNLEIVVVDDGSRDATGALLDEYAARCRSHSVTIVHQANAGAHVAINHGLALARGEVIALMNSDDRYAPSRLERLLEEMRRREAAFVFSNTRFIDDEGREVAPADPNVKQFRRAVADALRAPDLLYVLVYYNIAISTGNFVVRRELLDRTGGFCAMRVCHDWDLLLAASHETQLVFVDEPLYEYRLHQTNTFSGSRLLAAFELDQMLSRFFAKLGEHRIAADKAKFERFASYIRDIGLGAYLPSGARTAD